MCILSLVSKLTYHIADEQPCKARGTRRPITTESNSTAHILVISRCRGIRSRRDFVLIPSYFTSRNLIEFLMLRVIGCHRYRFDCEVAEDSQSLADFVLFNFANAHSCDI